ncbi:MAG: sugar ABC transporter permease [Propionibacteriaceae bacterium]|jgi:raffinose/stachyose/melibiose transport system permease protein|nr:sugar ABC transporter permease [Propionibacteriaceae bacterium]
MSLNTQKPGAASRRRTGPSAWLAAPALLFFGLFAIVPMFGVLYFSLISWDGMGDMKWIGPGNWQDIFSDDTSLNAMRLTLVVMVSTWLIQTPISLLLGVFMAGRQRYRALMSVLYFLPLLFSSAAIGIGFKAMLDPAFGIGSAIPVLSQDWLGSEELAMWTILFVISWTFVPFHSLLYQAGVRQIPVSMYEAARVDGAGAVRQFFSITLPQLKYTVITSSTLMLVGALTYFDLFFVMTQGGPVNATRILPLDMYLTGFRSFQMGKASAIAVILIVVGLALSLGLNRLSGSSKMESQMEGM